MVRLTMTAAMLIRPLKPDSDLKLVETFYAQNPDYWAEMGDESAPVDKAQEFFHEPPPPNCDPTQSLRLGLFESDRLAAIADLHFGFPDVGSAYIGLMIVCTSLQGQGNGRRLLAELEQRARAQGASSLALAVFDSNTQGKRFWRGAGFAETGHTGTVSLGRLRQKLLRMSKELAR